MGFSVSWMATSNAPAEAILEKLGLAPTGKEKDTAFESMLSAKSLSSGWHLIAINDYDHEITKPETLKRLTFETGCSAIVARIEEHVMASSAEQWTNGNLVWKVAHEGETGEPDLAIEGSPPPTVEAIRKEHLAMQARETDEVDWIFEVPLVLACGIVGFRHDGEEPDDDFEELQSTAPAKTAKKWKFW